MKKFADKKGYVDASMMKKLTRKMEQEEEVQFTPVKAKRHAGGGDRENKDFSENSRKRGRVQFEAYPLIQQSPSELTIYDQAVKLSEPRKSNLKRTSSSSEEEMEIYDSSDEMEFLEHNDHQQIMSNEFITDIKKQFDKNYQRDRSSSPMASCSGYRGEQHDNRPNRARADVPKPDYDEDALERLIRDAEKKKTRTLGTPGMEIPYSPPNFPLDISKNFVHSAMVDETYMSVASHLDENIIKKIELGDFVDFAKLVPRDRIITDDETELKLVMREGKTFYVPVRDNQTISSFGHWEQAFRVYSDIYSRAHPS